MSRAQQRIVILIVGLVLTLLVSALLYQFGMARLEAKPRTFWQSLEWAAETLSTTGYGADSRWTHPAMVVLVVVVQFIGVFLVFLIVPIVLVPYLEQRFEQVLPRRADERLSEHVIVFRFGPAVESLLGRLKDADVPCLVVETDEDAARGLLERGQPVVFVREEEDILGVVRLGEARAIVANGNDEENAALVLRARQNGFRGAIYSLVEEPAHRRPMELAGATSAYTPRHIIAAALAAHASDRISPRLPGFESLGGIERREIRVPSTSPLAGRTLAESELGRRSGAIVVGQWSRSHLQSVCGGDTRIEAGAVLELVGEPASLDAAAELLGASFLHRSGPFLIAGFGEVGRKVHQLLVDVEEDVRVIERQQGPGVDCVGNVLDPSVLERAGIHDARALILALDSDDATLFATVIARDTEPEVPVIARVNHARNLDNMHRAGADYALSISDISGEMLSARLLGRAARARDEHRSVVRVDAARFWGRAVGTLELRREGVSILAIERAGQMITRLDDAVVIEPRDALWICGNRNGLAKFS